MSGHSVVPRGMGWIPDLPDSRDYSSEHSEVAKLLVSLPPKTEHKDAVDLRLGEEDEPQFPVVGEQGKLNSSSAFATLALLQYFERRLYGIANSYSSMFLYKVTRNLRYKCPEQSCDVGADIRTTLKALLKFGVVDESLWPYDESRVHCEPSAFAYASARPRKDILYFRILDEDLEADQRYETTTAYLAAGIPLLMGVSIPTTISDSADLRFRKGLDVIDGGVVLLAVGFQHCRFGCQEHGILLRTSWGSQRCEDGYMWASSFLLGQQIRDVWTMISPNWIDRKELTRPVSVKPDCK